MPSAHPSPEYTECLRQRRPCPAIRIEWVDSSAPSHFGLLISIPLPRLNDRSGRHPPVA